MKNDNTILLLLAGVTVWYFWKQKQVPKNKVYEAGLFTKQAIENSNVFIPDESFSKQYKQDQAKCV
jgi:hypothetical protein